MIPPNVMARTSMPFGLVIVNRSTGSPSGVAPKGALVMLRFTGDSPDEQPTSEHSVTTDDESVRTLRSFVWAMG